MFDYKPKGNYRSRTPDLRSEKEKSKTNWWLIGILIGAVVIIIGFIFFKMKKKPKKKDMKSVIDEIERKYQKRYPQDEVSRRRPK